MALAYDADAPTWVATDMPGLAQQVTALADFERNASRLSQVSPLLIPGLLQTEDYMTAIMAGDQVPDGEIASRIALRAGRRKVLQAPSSVPYLAVVSHFALTNVMGSPAVMAAQLKHLHEMSVRPNIDLRVIRHDAGWTPAWRGYFYLIEGGQTVVYLEPPQAGLFLHKKAVVDTYRRAVDMVLNATLSREDSRKHVASVANRMEYGNR